jgi:mono/diheme cytochrome c family protein
MVKWIKRVGIVLAVLMLGLFGLIFGKRVSAKVATPQLKCEANAARLERGRYLVQSVASCGVCHTTGSLTKGQPSTTEFLAGDGFDHPILGRFAAPNITPDKETGIGNWTDGEIYKALKYGQRPNGDMLFPAMPYAQYRQMSDEDLYSIIAYLRTVPAVKHPMPERMFKMPFPVLLWGYIMYPKFMKEPVEAVNANDPVSRGRYIAMAGHCRNCHVAEAGPDKPDEERPWVGGFGLEGPWGKGVSSNLTGCKETGLGRYTDEQLAKILTTGVRPDGTELAPPMNEVVKYISTMTDQDRSDLVAFLRTIPAVKFQPEKSRINATWRK